MLTLPSILDGAPREVMRAFPVEHGSLASVGRRLTNGRETRHGCQCSRDQTAQPRYVEHYRSAVNSAHKHRKSYGPTPVRAALSVLVLVSRSTLRLLYHVARFTRVASHGRNTSLLPLGDATSRRALPLAFLRRAACFAIHCGACQPRAARQSFSRQRHRDQDAAETTGFGKALLRTCDCWYARARTAEDRCGPSHLPDGPKHLADDMDVLGEAGVVGVVGVG